MAAMIGPGLARSAIAGRVSHNAESQIIDLARPLSDDCALTILTTSDENPDSLNVLRHSAAHVMAEAICTLFPETKLVYGPPLEDGFYYDIDLPRSITPDDFPRIEAEMSRIIKENRPFCRYELPRDEAMVKLTDRCLVRLSMAQEYLSCSLQLKPLLLYSTKAHLERLLLIDTVLTALGVNYVSCCP